MTSVLTDGEILAVGHAQPQDRPLNLFDYARAIEAAVIKRLAAGVSVEPFAFAKWIDHPTDAGGDVCYYHPNATQPEGCMPLVTLDQLTTTIAAARVQENERCLAMMDAIGCDWRDAGDMAKFYATNYLREAIRALLGKEQS